MLYEMVSGDLPFQGEYDPALAYVIVNREPRPLSAQPGMPAGLAGVINKALAKNRGDRYGSAREFVRDIEQLLTDLEALPAGRAGSTRRSTRAWGGWRPRVRVAALSAIFIGAAALVWGGLALWPGRGEVIDSIAVLPLNNLSNDPEQEYFVDGMTDELIGQLGKVHALTVISRTSSMRYKDTEKSLAEIAHDLNVDAVVEGSVRRDGDRVRISIDLVDARTDKSMWSDTYDMAMASVFAVQTEVAAQVVGALRPRLSPYERERLEGVQPTTTDAYQLYLKGKFFSNKKAEPETRKAIRYYEQAIELDPEYATAYASLAIAYQSLSVYGHATPGETFPDARRCALKALELDEGLAAAHQALALLSMNDWDWETGEREFKRAIELGPNEPIVRDRYAFFLLWMDRTDEAVMQQTRAVELDPCNVALRQNLGEVLYYARRYDESIKASLEAIDMDKGYPQTHMLLGMAYAAKSMTTEAIRALDRDREISAGEKPEIESWIGVAYALAGQANEARQVYAGMVAESENRFMSPFPLACICFVLGDVDRGFEWLAEGYKRRDPRMSFLKVHPACDSVRTDPRYRHWLEKMGMKA
jgi:TolB-like protein/Tfp pilus assembly protein PilF